MVIVDERQTMKFLPMKTVPHSTGVWFSIPRPRNLFHKLAQNLLLTKLLPPKNTRYTVCVCKCASVYGEEEREDRRKAHLTKKLSPGI